LGRGNHGAPLLISIAREKRFRDSGAAVRADATRAKKKSRRQRRLFFGATWTQVLMIRLAGRTASDAPLPPGDLAARRMAAAMRVPVVAFAMPDLLGFCGWVAVAAEIKKDGPSSNHPARISRFIEFAQCLPQPGDDMMEYALMVN